MATAWDAFVSYARSNSERTAIAVQRGLQRFARPWNQRRAVRIFRDDSAMSTNPALWSAIEEGLSASGHLILLLSPAAATSAYIEKEVRWWLDHSSTGLSVAPVPRTDTPPVLPATRITGLSGVAAMEFLSPSRAVAGARTELVFLRFGEAGRGAAAARLSPRGVGGVPEYATDFRDSRLAVSPDRSRVAVLNLNGGELEIVPLPGRNGTALRRTAVGSSEDLDPLFGVVWLDEDTVLVASGQPGKVAKGLPAGVVRWNLHLPLAGDEGDRETPLAAFPTASGTVLIATFFGGEARTARVNVRDLASEAVLAQVCASAGGAISAGEWRRAVGDAPPDEPGCR